MAESVFLSPKSIAVIGASDKRGSVGATITSNIMNGFTGTVYPISPSRETVFYKKAYIIFEVIVTPTLPLLSDAPITAIDFGAKITDQKFL